MQPVKKVCSYLLLLTVLFSITPMQQLLKTPLLFKHYFEHQQRDPGIQVMRFLSMHYFGEDQKDNDQEQDMQLPFKKMNHCQLNYDFHSPVNAIKVVLPGCTNDYSLLPHQDLPDFFRGSLFKPPRA